MLPPSRSPYSGVVAVIVQDDRFLVIRRSHTVRAPRMFCFPGGAVEPGETEDEALHREMQEELAAQVRIERRLWQSVTPNGVQLGWWRTHLAAGSGLEANPAEVESVHWLTAEEMWELPELLPSNRGFLRALRRSEFQLDE